MLREMGKTGDSYKFIHIFWSLRAKRNQPCRQLEKKKQEEYTGEEWRWIDMVKNEKKNTLKWREATKQNRVGPEHN
jgi:hypothetical protein